MMKASACVFDGRQCKRPWTKPGRVAPASLSPIACPLSRTPTSSPSCPEASWSRREPTTSWWTWREPTTSWSPREHQSAKRCGSREGRWELWCKDAKGDGGHHDRYLKTPGLSASAPHWLLKWTEPNISQSHSCQGSDYCRNPSPSLICNSARSDKNSVYKYIKVVHSCF